jgi:membrane-bound serine protease (ClpP class)
VGLALVALEIFIPSGGILGFLAVSAVLASIFVAFTSGGTAEGLIFVAIAIIGMPSALLLALKWLPRTPFGRRLMLGIPDEDDVLPADDPRHELHELVGKWGTARSDMLPGGAIKIDGRTFEAVCEAGSIEAGEPVEVVKVRNNRLVVRKSRHKTAADKSDDILSQPIDSVGADPFEEPLS